MLEGDSGSSALFAALEERRFARSCALSEPGDLLPGDLEEVGGGGDMGGGCTERGGDGGSELVDAVASGICCLSFLW